MPVIVEQPLSHLHRALLRVLPPECVLADRVSRGIYATDASIYEVQPLAVVTPRDEADIAAVLRIAREQKAPVLARGGGTSLAGQTTNHAIVLDLSKHLTRVLEVNAAEKWCRVEPGLVRDELNAHLAPQGVEFAPETSTSNRAVIGGMIGNNSSGVRSIRYGRTLEHVLGGRIMLASGDIIECVDRSPAEAEALSRDTSAEGRLWKTLVPLLRNNRGLIDSRFPKVLRRVGGYSLDEYPEAGPWNLMKLMTGSEGTLAVILEARLRLVTPPRHIATVAVHYGSLDASLRSVPVLLEHNPLSVEIMDRKLLALSRVNPSTCNLCGFIVGDPESILCVELDGESKEDLSRNVQVFLDDLKSKSIGYAWPVFQSVKERSDLAELRKKGLGVMTGVVGDTKPISFVEDSAVPPEHLADYIAGVTAIFHRHGYEPIMYGHASVGVLHIKPSLNLKTAKGIADMESISRDVMNLVKQFNGSWSGEHGDGIARGWLNEEFWGPEMTGLFRAVKLAFDPGNMMNPRRLLDTPRAGENLRLGADYKARLPKSHFHFTDQGGLPGAIEMCNGVGECRKTLRGTMCPSYMATRDEEHTTRGRANALRLAMDGRLGKGAFTSQRLHDVLDLCLECKACKTECPSNVDMARLKSEFLSHYHAARGGPALRDKLFAESPRMARMAAGALAPLANWFSENPVFRNWLQPMFGIAPSRRLPPLTRQTFDQWWKIHRAHHRRNPSGEHTKRMGTVALFVDCFAASYEPRAAQWAVRALERLGYQVRPITNQCCQRTRISKGLLKEAAQDGARTVRALSDTAGTTSTRVPILTLEPSCQSSLVDDLPDLVKNRNAAKRVAQNTLSVEEFLSREIDSGRLPVPQPQRPADEYLLHGHCHQKALFGTNAVQKLLSIPGENVAPVVTEVDSGCCGMAGSFGYEASHDTLSRAIGERRLAPAVRAASDQTIIVAPGFSCRHQIADLTARHAIHPIEAFARGLLGKWHRR